MFLFTFIIQNHNENMNEAVQEYICRESKKCSKPITPTIVMLTVVHSWPLYEVYEVYDSLCVLLI